MARRTKIVATLGPASQKARVVRELIDAGIDVARLNLAHATPADHERLAGTLRQQAAAAGRVVGVLADLPGPKIRSGPVADGEVELIAGEHFVITTEEVDGDSKRVSTTFAGLPECVGRGDEIFLADGDIVLHVDDAGGGEVSTEVVRGGTLRSRKGMHAPDAELQLRAFTRADQSALRLALGIGADLVGLSFVCDGSDVVHVRDSLPQQGHRPLIVAKIETRAAVDHLDEIVEEADALMVARGDLGIQTSLTRVPLLQKEIIHACNRRGKPVITATQMLESMTRSPKPTRAEVADVANAVIDGTDALMLSEETAVGDFPVAAVETMAETAERAEAWPSERDIPQRHELTQDRVSWALAHAAVQAAQDLDVAAIVCPTRGGTTVRRVAAFRPTMSIIGVTTSRAVIGSLALVWGVTPLEVRGDDLAPRETRQDVERVVSEVVGAGLVRRGDLVAIVAGSPGPRAGRTDYLRVVRA